MKALVNLSLFCLALRIAHSSKHNLTCYFCDGRCKDPLETLTCNRNPEVEYWCISSKGITGDRLAEFKGCVDPNFTVDLDNCKRLDEQEHGSCYTCKGDLCNAASERTHSLVVLYLAVGVTVLKNFSRVWF